MKKMNYLAACVVAVTALSALAAVDVGTGVSNHNSQVNWTIDGVPQVKWEAQGHAADLGNIDLSKFPSATAGTVTLPTTQPLFSLAMAQAGAPKALFMVPQIAYQNSTGAPLTMVWDANAKEGTLTVPAKMDTDASKTFTLAVKVVPVSLARIANSTHYLDVAVTQGSSSESSLFKGLACHDCTLPVLSDRALAPALFDRINSFDVSSLQADANQQTAIAPLNTGNLGSSAQETEELVQGADQSYTVADSQVMLGAGLLMNAGTVAFNSTAPFTAGKWTAPITVVVSAL